MNNATKGDLAPFVAMIEKLERERLLDFLEI